MMGFVISGKLQSLPPEVVLVSSTTVACMRGDAVDIGQSDRLRWVSTLKIRSKIPTRDFRLRPIQQTVEIPYVWSRELLKCAGGNGLIRREIPGGFNYLDGRRVRSKSRLLISALGNREIYLLAPLLTYRS